MFKKAITVAGILLAVSLTYLLMSITMPLIADFASTSNLTISASSNISQYDGLQGGLLGAPLVLYFIPAIIGIILVVITLREP